MGRMNPAVQYLIIAALMLHSFFCTKGECLLGFCADRESCCSAFSPVAALDESHGCVLEQPIFLFENETIQVLEHHHAAHHHGVCHCLEIELLQNAELFFLLLTIAFCVILPADSLLSQAVSILHLRKQRIPIKNRRLHLIMDRFLV